MKNIPVFAAFAVSRSGNRGAVSMLESAIDYLTTQEKQAKINVFSVYPKFDKANHQSEHVQILNGKPVNLAFHLIPMALLYQFLKLIKIDADKLPWSQDMKGVIEADVCLMIGGTTFTDAQQLKIIFNIACLLPAIILKKKSMMYSQTLGPFNTWFNHTAASYCLGKMDYIVPRGDSSLQAVQALKLNVPTSYFTDSAFSLQVPDDVKARIHDKYAPQMAGKKVVGISINSIVEENCQKLGIDHHSAWEQFIKYLLEKEYKILFIPHSIRTNNRSRHNNDIISAREIMERIGSTDQIILIEELYDCKELREVVGLCDYYVASRFHSMISALCCKIPVSVFGWGYHKYEEVMSEFELAEYCHDAKDLSPENLINGFNKIHEDQQSIKERIERNLERVKDSSLQNHRTAWSLLDKNG